jgi:2-hydroxy-6-oxonona-2,4-dienedioate hydrolase
MNEARYREAEQRLWESVGLTPTEQQLRLDRTGVTVRAQEVGEGPAIVFVHGSTNSGVSWATLVARLDGFRCVLVDRPGCGLSEPLPYTLDDPERLGAYGDALIVDVLDALKLDHAHVVATSFGGYFALRAAAAHPDRVDRVVEFGWTVGAPIGAVPLMLRFGGIPTFGRLAGMVPPTERAVRAMLRSIGLRGALATGRFSQQMVDTYLSLLRDTYTMRNELKAGPHTFRLRGFNKSVFLPQSLLGTIHTPTYFLWGEDDPTGDAEIARQFVRNIPGAEIEMMPGAGHAVWIDDPDHAAATTRRFLGGERQIDEFADRCARIS